MGYLASGTIRYSARHGTERDGTGLNGTGRDFRLVSTLGFRVFDLQGFTAVEKVILVEKLQ